MHIDWEMILALSAIATLLGTAFLWIIKMILAPMKVVVEDNTSALRDALVEIRNQAKAIADLDKRVAIIENVHEMEVLQ